MGSMEQLRQNRSRLDSWKAIAQYLGRDVRSVQRWERERGLPVHRVPGQKSGGVFAYEDELEQWLHSGQQESLVVAETPAPANSISPPEVPVQNQGETEGHRPSRVRWLTAFAIVLILTSGLTVAWRRGLLEASTAGPIRSIAVLPLQNLSSDPNQEYFADGMTNELITDLAQVRELKVVSKTSIMQYKGTRKPLPQIGNELGVDAVVEGSVLRSGDRVRITAQLIRTSTDRHLWAQSYEGDLRNVLGLQARVAEAITDEVRLSLSAQERSRFNTVRSYDPEAYDLYLRGRYAFGRRNEAAFQEAIGYFKQAAAKDPEFPLAYAGLSDCDTLLALDGDGYSWVVEANADARKALERDDDLAEAHTSLAAAEVLDWKWSDAEKEFRRALDLNSNSAQAHQWYGNLLLGPLGRHSEAIAELQRALELDPLSLVVNTDLGYAYFLAGQDDLAYQQFQKVVAMDSTFLPVHFDLASYYDAHGMYDKEIQELITDYTLAGHPDIAESMRQLANQPGKLFVAMAQTDGTLNHPTEAYDGSAAVSVGAYLRLGKKQQALASLEKSYARHDPNMLFLRVDPSLAGLRNEPEFQDLERKVGLLSP
jgi:TolB-like protein